MVNLRDLVLDPRWSHVRVTSRYPDGEVQVGLHIFAGWATVVTKPSSLHGPEETAIEPAILINDEDWGRPRVLTMDGYLAERQRDLDTDPNDVHGPIDMEFWLYLDSDDDEQTSYIPVGTMRVKQGDA